MSLIPRNNNNNITTFLEEPQQLWDHFFSSPFPSTSSTVPYSELDIETSGKVKAKVECKEVEEAHLIIAELTGVDKHGLNVSTEEGGFVTINASGDGNFFWRGRLPRDACFGMLSWSMENGVLTILVPKSLMGGWDYWGGIHTGRTNVRQIDIEGSD